MRYLSKLNAVKNTVFLWCTAMRRTHAIRQTNYTLTLHRQEGKKLMNVENERREKKKERRVSSGIR